MIKSVYNFDCRKGKAQRVTYTECDNISRNDVLTQVAFVHSRLFLIWQATE